MVTVADTLADSNLAVSKLGPGRLARKKAEEKVEKYALAAAASQATHLPFAVETMGGLSESALRLLREIHHSASTHCTWRDADAIGSHLLDSVAIAVQKCTGMALCIRHGDIVPLSSQQYQHISPRRLMTPIHLLASSALRASREAEMVRVLGADAA